MGVDDNEVQKTAAPAPEDVAREFIHSSEMLVPVDAFANRHRLRRAVVTVGLVLVVAAAAVGAVLIVRHHDSKTTPDTGGTAASNATMQAAADALAVKSGCPTSTSTPTNTQSYAGPSSVLQPQQLYAATVVTTAGSFTIALDAVTEPSMVNDFLFLAQRGYYNCATFFRVITGQSDQTGDPTGTGNGTPGYTVPAVVPATAANAKNQYPLGTVVMANVGQSTNSSSQWFVIAGAAGESLPPAFSVFGRVTAGMSVVEKINADGSNSGTPNVIQRVLYVTVASSHALN
jgi:peptidyl-prolyl cis-trans isomerase B (cyclophilin B)